MHRTVVALFDDVDNAQRAVEELLIGGFNRNDISVVKTGPQAKTGAATPTGPYSTEPGGNAGAGAPGEPGGTATDPDATGQGATATGAGVGAVLGGIAGLVVGLGALAIPGIGPIVAAGPLAAALAGAGVGAATGGVIGALTDAGIPKSEAEEYAEGVRRGGTLVTVRTSEGEYGRAMTILNSFSPVDMRARAMQWRTTSQTGSTVNPTPYTNVYNRSFEDFENDFRGHCQTCYGGTGYGYDRYRPAYEYGWQAHSMFRGRDWEGIEPELRADWEQTHPSHLWEDFKEAIHTGWEHFDRGARGPNEDVEPGFGDAGDEVR